MILILDTESTGFFKKASDPSDEQHRVVEMSWSVLNAEMEEVARVDTLINCGRPSSEGALKVHGITEQMTVDYGVQPLAALHMLKEHTQICKVLSSYNLDFEVRAIKGECKAVGQRDSWIDRPGLRHLCLMKRVAEMVHWNGGRFLKLVDAHIELFGEPFVDSHRARADVEAAIRIARKLHGEGRLLI